MEKTAVSILSRYCFPGCYICGKATWENSSQALVCGNYLCIHPFQVLTTARDWHNLKFTDRLERSIADSFSFSTRINTARKKPSFEGHSPFIYLVRHWSYLLDKMDQTSPLSFCILLAVKTWVVRMPGNDASLMINGTNSGKIKFATNQSSRQLQTSHVCISILQEKTWNTLLRLRAPTPSVLLPTCR